MSWRLFQICFTARLLTLGNEIKEHRKTLLCRKYGKWVLQFCIYVPVIYLWFDNAEALLVNDIVDLWLAVEIVQIVAEPLFFQLLSRHLKMTIE